MCLAVFLPLSVSLSQIQLVDDGADTTSPETPEPGTGRVPKRGKSTCIQFFFSILELFDR